jgi:hypothetical protein
MALRTQAGIGCLRPFTVYSSSRHGGTSGYRLQQIEFEITIPITHESGLRVDSLLI